MLFLLAAASACSIKKYAIRQVGASLNSGSSVFESDEDIELVGEALPSNLKLIEALLVEVPDDRNLLLAACRGFTIYSYAYVDFEAERTTEEDLAEGRRIRERAHRLYRRAHGYCLRGLDRLYADSGLQLQSNPAGAVAVTNPKKKQRDLPVLYWTAASLGLAISTAKDDAAMLARLPEVDALLARALELDPGWAGGALHSLKIVLSGAKTGPLDREAIDHHFQRAVELSDGQDASVFVAYAEAVAIPDQDSKLFRSMLEMSLAVDPDDTPDDRLGNLLAQRRAKWLLDRIEDLFLIVEEPSQ